MSDSKSDSLNFAMLARAGEGFTEWRALLLTMGSSLVCALLYWVMAYATAGLSGWMLGLVWLLFAVLIAVAGSIGYSASGVMLMDRALQRPVQSMSQAFGAGLRCMPRMLMLGAGVLVGLLVIALLASVVYLLCKIPVLGAVLGFVAHSLLSACGLSRRCMHPPSGLGSAGSRPWGRRGPWRARGPWSSCCCWWACMSWSVP